MFSFKTRTKQTEASRILLKIVNNQCSHMTTELDTKRDDRRVNLTQVVRIIPFENEVPLVEQSFSVLTKDFSVNGICLAMERPFAYETVLVGIPWESEFFFLKCEYRNQEPLGSGFWQVGLALVELVQSADYPSLKAIQA